MDSKAAMLDKPHAVCIPCPYQSHIKAMLGMAKLLHHKGFQITFVNTEFNNRCLLKARGFNALDGLPDFRFESIPDGLPPLGTQDLSEHFLSLRKNLLVPLRDLVLKLDSSEDVPPVTCIVSDGFMTFSITVAKELGIPIVLFFTISACSFMGIKAFRTLKEKGLAPLKDESYKTDRYLDTMIDWIPGMRGIHLRDLPCLLHTTATAEKLFDAGVEAAESASEASAIIIHTFDAMESEVLGALSTIFPRIYAIGPLQLLLCQISDNRLSSIGWNLRKEEPECLEWLDSKEPNSVIYVNFGSVATVTKEQLIEIALGLNSSNHSFLWIIRPDMVIGDSGILPSEFKETTTAGGRGFIASWCSQEEVLHHPSIGGFLTHCGWNSMVESVVAGVPILCWPFFSDQLTNRKYACDEWGIGISIRSDAKRDEVEKLVRELMEGEKGKKLRDNVVEWKKMAEEAAKPNGSSYVALDKLVNEVLLSK